MRALGVLGALHVSFLGRGLDQLCREVPRFGQQEEADLLHVGAGRHVDVVAGLLFVEAGGLCVVVELLVDFLEVPGVLELNDVEDDVGLGRDAVDVRPNPFSKVLIFAIENQVQFVNRKFVLLDESDGWTPGVPPGGACAAVRIFLCAENRDDRCLFHASIIPRTRWCVM